MSRVDPAFAEGDTSCPLFVPGSDIGTIVAALVSRLDDAQAQAFLLKMAELDAASARLH